MTQSRSFKAATGNSLYADFTNSNASADTELYPSIQVLRNRSRFLERNNSFAKRFVQLMKDNVVGPEGIRVVSMARNADGGLDRGGNDRVNLAVKWWSKVVTADGLMSMSSLLKAVVRGLAVDGEAFLELKVGPRYRDRVGFTMIEPDLIDHNANGHERSTGNRVRMGVEIDDDERPVAYHILYQHPGDSNWTPTAANGSRTRRVSAENIIHIYEKTRPHQTRGQPPMASAMTSLQMLDGYREAEITHRRIAASKMGFFERDPESGPLKAMSDSEDPETDELEIDVEPGQFRDLPIGRRFKAFDANSTSTDYASFERQIIRSIASALGPSYFDLGNDLADVNYSSIRQGALTDRDFYRGMQSFVVERCLAPVVEQWLKYNVGGPDVNDKLRIPATRLEKFVDGLTYLPRGWTWVDPQKEVNASIKGIENKLTSRSKIISESGGDFERIVDDLEREQEMIANAGIETPTETQ